MKEYSKGIYVKFKPEEVEILHDRMKEAGVQNMSAYIRKIQKRESELIKSVSVVLRFIRSPRGLGHFPNKKKCAGYIPGHCLPICKKERILIMIKNKVVIKERDAWADLANFIGEMVAKYADAMGLAQLPDPDNYLRMKRIKQLYMKLYKTENIEKFRNIIVSIERNAVA